MIKFNEFGLGWQRDLPDYRDYTPDSEKINTVLSQSKALDRVQAKETSSIPRVDLRDWCPPIEDQGPLGSCTAHAATSMVEYYQKRGFNTYTDSSRLFIYKVTRNLLQVSGDNGAYLRSAMKALVLFGVPPEIYWPYDVNNFDKEPSAFCYAFAQNYKAIKYFRHDPPGSKPEEVLIKVKTHLAAGLPTMFGFTVFSSMPPAGVGKGTVMFPIQGDSMVGGHAVLAVGYDDEIPNGPDTGALLIRNSWGPRWGDDGYGWLPYSYVLKGLAADFWSMVHADFVNLHMFE